MNVVRKVCALNARPTALIWQTRYIATQLDNGYCDLYYHIQDEARHVEDFSGSFSPKEHKMDLARDKKTLPIVFATNANPTLFPHLRVGQG